jgi:basic membrane protein A and related proteins
VIRALAGLALAAVAAAGATGAANRGADAADGGAQRPFACLVTGGGGPWTGSYAPAAAAGMRAAARSGIRGVRINAPAPRDYAPALRACAARGAAVTIAAGYPMAAAVDLVASELPRSRFAVLDVDVDTLPHRPRNVQGVLFAEQQAGYLVGYAAGLWARERRAASVGAVAGLDVPPVERYLAGFRFGAQRAYPGLRVQLAFAKDVSTPAVCRKEAVDQIGDGSVVEFAVAGACGRGVVEAARSRRVFAIGVGAATSGGSWVMTRALERVDVAVEAVIRSARAGSFRTGVNVVYGADRDGIGHGAWSPRVPAEIRRAVATEAAMLRAGRISAIPVALR